MINMPTIHLEHEDAASDMLGAMLMFTQAL